MPGVVVADPVVVQAVLTVAGLDGLLKLQLARHGDELLKGRLGRAGANAG